jgi:alpha-ribazole phosphatase
MEIYLIRHTTPDVEKGICYGHSEVPLKNTFEEEADQVWQNLPSNVTMIYSSPLQRCLRLANYLSSKFHIPVIQDHRLMELNFGAWEMKRWDDIDKNDLDKWMNNFVDTPTMGGESFSQLANRVNEFYKQLMDLPKQTVIVVTHAGAIRSLLCAKRNIPLINAFSLECPYSSVTKVIDDK